jgi:hypothetical protein
LSISYWKFPSILAVAPRHHIEDDNDCGCVVVVDSVAIRVILCQLRGFLEAGCGLDHATARIADLVTVMNGSELSRHFSFSLPLVAATGITAPGRPIDAT